MRHLLAASLASTMLVGCATAIWPAGSAPNGVLVGSTVSMRLLLTGRVQLPVGFRTRATSTDVVGNANVTLMTAAGDPVAAGLTDGTGYFRLYDSTNSFTPATNTCYLLDFSKRLPAGAASNLIGLRTVVQYTGSAWTSITGTAITINTTTSAMALLQAASGTVALADLIGMVTVNGAVSTVLAASPIAAAAVAAREGTVSSDLAANRDPLGDLAACAPPVVPLVGFTSTRGGANDFWAVKRDGTGLTNLTANFAPDVWGGAFSPDGRKIVLYTPQSLYVANADGTNPVKITAAEVVPLFLQGVAWSPDSQKLVFQAFHGGTGNDICTINPDGSGLTTVANTTDEERYPVWLNNGKVAWVVSLAAGGSAIRMANPDGTSQATVLTNATDTISDLAVAPGGQKLAYALTPAAGGASTIRWTMTDGSTNGIVAAAAGFNAFPAWSPTGNKIAFKWSATGAGNWQIKVANADGTGTVALPTTGRSDYNPFWSTDGSKLLFTSFGAVGADEVMVMDASDGGNRINLSNDAATDFLPGWGG